MQIEKKTLRNVFIGVVSCIVLYWVLHETERVKTIYNLIKGILSPFALGAGLAFILNVPMRVFERLLNGIKKDTWRRLLAILLTFFAFLLVLALVFILLIPQISDTIQSLIPKLNAFVVQAETVVKDFLENNPKVMDLLKSNTDFDSLNWSSIVKNMVSMVGNGFSTVLGGA